ncbi:hypothetical protein PZA11_005702 [Diplocarpon coronariae]|uniref:K Homology domain-containing protein n=1 Tax=Diplocarpon coronariae TaxID=2795749 RepID=A0A218Z2L9_9HELO|nr:hypothetical protein JHW43_002787 [Diplocarpon mali]OWP02331.1 hypothetical protein B2J93_3119 [Marssonina coronariae]
MGDPQANIAQILAALAAQTQGNSAPAPVQQSTYQPAPQSQPPQQQQYALPGGYSLPQPSSSGSVDLSNIKPVNSGTVSLSDAIAKAKAIAAQKGVAYDRAPLYGAPHHQASGRPYQPTRSRSRSPPIRRDAFRDNFNPYRDERRGDRAPVTRDYRERSFSPAGQRGRGPAGAFSPSQAAAGYSRNRSPPRAAEDNTVESISIESNLVGLIIGRQGENMRRVEAETGCRVQFVTGQDDSVPYRECKITGLGANRAKAKAEINRIIDDSGMAANARAAAERAQDTPLVRGSSHQPALRDGEDSMQIMVPDRTVGLIIGRGGETIRDLQERSGCHVNIVGEQKSVNGLRPVNLIGSREAAAHAKDLIMEIVESDSKTGSKEPGPPARAAGRDAGFGGGGYGGAPGGAGGDSNNDSIFVPSEAVGMIIGKGGETIKDIQSSTGCKINVSPKQPGETDREIGLVGSRDAIAAAKRAIGEKVEAVAAKSGRGGGGSGGRSNDYGGDRYTQQQSYSQHQVQSSQPASQTAPAPGGEDPYAAYGGYQNYVALWYQALAQQQGGQQPQGDPSKPPGTS